MKLNKKYLIETILEVMSANSEFANAKEMKEWFDYQIKEGVRKIKTGEGDFNFEEFAKVAEKLMKFPDSTAWLEFKSPNNRLSQKPPEVEVKKEGRK